MMGRKDVDAAQAMIDHYGLEGKMDPHKFIKDRRQILEELFPTCQLLPGMCVFTQRLFEYWAFINLVPYGGRLVFEWGKKMVSVMVRLLRHCLNSGLVFKQRLKS